MYEEIECTECGWQGDLSELIAHPDDENKTARETRFVVCPQCDSIDTFEDIDYD